MEILQKKNQKRTLPEDWSFYRLGDLVEEVRGIRYGIVQPGEFDPEGRFMIRGQDYSKGWVAPGEYFRVSPEVEKKYRNARVKAGDLIMTIVGAGTGNIARIPEFLNGANLTQTTARIAIDHKKANEHYCKLVLESEAGQSQVRQNIKGGAQPGLNCGDLENFVLPMPSAREEQQEISKIMISFEEAAGCLECLIGQKEKRKRSLMQQLLSGEKLLPGSSGEWREVRLDEVATNSSLRNKGTVPDDRLYAVTKAEGLIPMRENVKGATTDRCRVVKNDWFAYNPMRLNIGSISRLQEEEPAMVSPDYVVFYCHEDRLDPDFLDHLRRTRRWQHFVNVAGNGSVRVRIYFKDLGSFKFPLPPIEEQRRIAEILNTCDREIELHRRQLEAIREQKRGLMQKLLTGEVRVKITTG